MHPVDHIVKELEALEELKRSLKARAMIYQVEAKERAAKRDGLPFDAYYDLTYKEWERVRGGVRQDEQQESEPQKKNLLHRL